MEAIELTRQAKKCHQCGKCSAGCPVAFAMERTPRQIIRLHQLDAAEEALKSMAVCRLSYLLGPLSQTG